MVYVNDLQQLVSQWQEKMKDSSQSEFYRDALYDCIYDLNSLIDKSVLEEIDYNQMLEEAEADSFLSSIAAHEVNA